MEFTGPGTRLTSADVAKASLDVGCESAVLLALMQIESNVVGFDTALRPKILFEPYVFYRRLPVTLRATGLRSGLAAASGSQIKYVRTSDANYARLMDAMKIDEAAAIEACSWGIGQILGANFKSVGFASPQEMAFSAVASEQNQLSMMVAFLKVNKLVDALRSKDWKTIARIYNGPNYAANGYDRKLEKYYANWYAQGGILPVRPPENTAPNDAHRIPTAPIARQNTPASPPSQSKDTPMMALAGYKTYILAGLTILYAVFGVALRIFGHDGTAGLPWQDGINLVIAALFGSTFRSAMKTQTGGLGSMLATVGEQISTALGDIAPTQAATTPAAEPAKLHPDDILTIVTDLASKFRV